MTDKHNHCIIANGLTVCSDPIEHCRFFKAGYEDCFYHTDQRCCHARAIMARYNCREEGREANRRSGGR